MVSPKFCRLKLPFRTTVCAIALFSSSAGHAQSSVQEKSSAQADQQKRATLRLEIANEVNERDALVAGFEEPPMSARPRVWWHWLSGNISKQGIAKDLRWMKRTGIAGAMMFDGDPGAPKIVPERITVRTPAWYDALSYSAAEASRLGLEFTIAASPGWSETGGPWVTPDMAMKKFMWSETRVAGGKPVGQLAPLPDIAGPFQDIPAKDFLGRALAKEKPFSRDIAVFAYQRPVGDVLLSSLSPVITASEESLDSAKLTDGVLDRPVLLGAPAPGKPIWIRFDFSEQQTMRALTYAGPLTDRSSKGPVGRIEASDDGTSWRSLRSITGQGHSPAPQRTFAFAATPAKHFRVIFDQAGVSTLSLGPPGIALSELAFVPGARVDLFEDRSGFGVIKEADAIVTATAAADAVIRPETMINVTRWLRADGTLEWTPPKGDWVILRTGYGLTGEHNHPATPEGTGLEVDKLNSSHVRAHLDAYITPVIDALGENVGRQGLQAILTDSWEARQETWTEAMVAEFQKRRGYDPTPYLPVLTGRVVGSAERSDAFLWDFRRTLADLVADNHYGTITQYAKEHGLAYYGEATGAAWPTVADGMLAKSKTDIPMGEYWQMPFGGKPANFIGGRSDEFPADIIETRSTSHVYGKPLVAAEALTSSQPLHASSPWKLKWVADKYMAMGVNLHVLHTSAHQPNDEAPGLALAPFGQTFTRHETWSEMAKPWIDYLARSSYLLQQGAPVTDLLYFYGEGAPSGVPYDSQGDPAHPEGHGFDYVNADALLRLAKVEDGKIIFPGGASYRVLVLPKNLTSMTLPLLKKLQAFVDAGAVIMGPRPLRSPSLSSNTAEVKTAADQLWGQIDGRGLTVNTFGKGRVYQLDDAKAVLKAEGIEEDFHYFPTEPGMNLVFNHRRLANADVYFISNQSNVAAKVPGRFRVAGRAPEFWDPVTGERRDASYNAQDKFTRVPLNLMPYQSLFVVFRKPATVSAMNISAPREMALAALDNGWTLKLPKSTGVQPSKTNVGSWTSASDPNMRYFSGTAVYDQSINAPLAWLKKGRRIFLELGDVGDVAQVTLNGADMGVAWSPPYRVDITKALRPGTNRFTVKVANTWQNRLVGDLQPQAAPKAWTNKPTGIFALLVKPIKTDTPLTPSGLLGPVRIVASE